MASEEYALSGTKWQSIAAARQSWIALFVLTAVYALNGLDRQILGLLVEPIRADLQISDTQIGFLSGAAFALFYVTLGLPLARLADRANRRNIIAASVAVFSAATVLCGLAGSFATLLLARIGVAVGEAGPTPASLSLFGDRFPPQKQQMVSAVFTAGSFAGIIAGFIIAGYVSQVYGWRASFLVAGVPGLLLAAAVVLLVREPPRHETNEHKRESLLAVIRRLLRLPTFIYISLGWGTSMIVNASAINWVPAFLVRSYSFSQVQVAVFLAVCFGVFGGIGTLCVGSLMSKLRRRGSSTPLSATSWIIALCAACYVVAFTSTLVWLSLLMLAIPLFLSGAVQAVSFAMTQELVPPNQRATATAILLFTINLLGLGIGPQLVGLLSDMLRPTFDHESLRHALLWVVGVAGLSAALIFRAAAARIKRDPTSHLP